MSEFDNLNGNQIDNQVKQGMDDQEINNQETNNQGMNNQGLNGQGLNNQNSNYKMPEYSFWAEQTRTSSYANNDDSNNNYSNNSYSNNNYPNSNYPNSNYPKNNYASNNYSNSNYSNNNTTSNTWGSNYNSNTGSQYDYQSENQYTANTRPKKERKFSKFILKSLCFGIIAGVSFIGMQKLYYAVDPGAKQIMINATDEQLYEVGYTKSGEVQHESKTAVSAIANLTIPSIVSINSISNQPSQWFGQQFNEEVESSGSGFVVGKSEEELLIATNNHVVEGTTTINVTFIDGSEAVAVIKGTDAAADLAVISVDISSMEKDTLDVIKIATLGSSDDVAVGEMAIAIGNALGYGQSVTVGYISAKDREVQVSDGYSSKTMVLLQTDAAINPGNSGGALLNIKGEVIGINTVKYSSNVVEGMGYAIPISNAIPIINELMSREILTEDEQGYLGIAGNDVTEEISSYYNMPIGVFVNELSEGAAADQAGIMPGDIIIGVGDIEITSISQLKEYVNSLRVGTEVNIIYMRSVNGEFVESSTTVTLGKNPFIGNNIK